MPLHVFRICATSKILVFNALLLYIQYCSYKPIDIQYINILKLHTIYIMLHIYSFKIKNNHCVFWFIVANYKTCSFFKKNFLKRSLVEILFYYKLSTIRL